ncbi:hypothetical protein RND71_038332 [Anisodus tanguticus]|uniref:Uncharacterized protein n=1 Tax=Anisodus tanguticus TaxID=243964 RepID=A0AAE1QZU6_9SOLA|nr:hypothetical protein RND71_038332 [Anisodus tanguticus]
MEFHLFFQRIDIEKSRHRTVVISDIRKQIMALNHKVWEEWKMSLVGVQDGLVVPGKRIDEASDYFMHVPLGSGGYNSPGKDVNRKSLSTPTRNPRDHQEAEKRSQSTTPIPPGAVRRVERNQVPRCITVKDVIAVLESEPQMSKSTVIYHLHEKIRSDAPGELS